MVATVPATKFHVNGKELFSLAIMDEESPPQLMNPQPAPDFPPVWTSGDVTIMTVAADATGLAPDCTGVAQGSTTLTCVATFLTKPYTGVCDVEIDPNLNVTVGSITIVPGAITP
jgi:hypothetical protein